MSKKRDIHVVQHEPDLATRTERSERVSSRQKHRMRQLTRQLKRRKRQALKSLFIERWHHPGQRQLRERSQSVEGQKH